MNRTSHSHDSHQAVSENVTGAIVGGSGAIVALAILSPGAFIVGAIIAGAFIVGAIIAGAFTTEAIVARAIVAGVNIVGNFIAEQLSCSSE